ncbi:BREX-1 system adenine-specific DNA-methyltransferase PglX [Butyrivibrio sp. MC2013]|uniref:BREX-1 system adenine-specific DNA-methyltransferase PglX n=1 Tax=Butyrivibrio sp. MC2013 TaxID=1280686 RepID=UPI00041A020E|nr:BREX-1 system adenine-specific DNA-methyltransferase PglX [Butyrivibrio sp. MC2013]
MDKTAIRNFAIEARKILMKSAITEAGFYGITKDGCKDPVQKGNDFEVYETVAGTENRIFGDDIKRRANLVQAIKTLGFEQVIEETAYTWFNRIIAIRFMEVNNYLPTRVRVLSSETGSGTPDIITQADTVELNLTSDELEKIQTAKRENRYDDAFRMLFIKQCNELNAILPGLFEKTDDYMELLLKITYTGDGVIRMLVDSIPEDNFNVETEGQVEIIGWMYQYYNTELKDDTFAKLKKNVKITKERIPAATQLFTPDWIVRYMVENSLGRVWIEHLRAVNPSVDEKAKAEEFGWKYYLPEAEQEDDVQAQLVEIRKSYKNLTPQDITCIDPCMGSGHILVYMFDVLMDIYRSEGFSEREAVFDVLEKNIRGLDIDRRAYQLSYFALMMKARGYNRIFFRGHEDIDGNRVQAVPRVYAIEESNSIDRSVLQFYGAGLDELQKNNAVNQMNGLLDSLKDAKEFGSILNVENYDWQLLRLFISSISEEGQGSLFGYVAYMSKGLLEKIVDIGIILSDKYDAVVTNPPYMGSKGMSATLQSYIQENYLDEKYDLFAVFISRCLKMANSSGFSSLVTMQSWMFLSSFEKMREKLERDATLSSLLHMGNMVMGIAFGTAVSIYSKRKIPRYNSRFSYVELKDIDKDKPYAFPTGCCRDSIDKIESFDVIPGKPIAYWAGPKMLEHFVNAPALSDKFDLKQGLITADNDRFLRYWQEVNIEKIGLNTASISDFVSQGKKWLPYTKGGDYRKWYGNNSLVVNWENDGFEIKNFKNDKGKLLSRPQNIQYFFREGGSWSILTNGFFSMRYTPVGFGFDARGSMMFSNSGNIKYAIALLCSNVGAGYLEFLSPTVSFEVGNLSKVPFYYDEGVADKIEAMADKCINLCKEDWDLHETSWDFSSHPFLKYDVKRLEDAYNLFDEDNKSRRDELRTYEERINEILIDEYGLSGRISKKVEENTLSIEIYEKKRVIEEFISYAVGCMFGRYSIDEPCVAYAGGNWNTDKYKSYMPDKDNIIPITDEEYFDDDIVKRFIDFLVTVFGKENLEDNLSFIAEGLCGEKNSNSREMIRKYFLNDFYKFHCDMYSVTGLGKRPIYWLFDSGKQNGFKCLIYLHRYTQDTVGLIRSDYLTKTQGMIENALRNAEYAINSSTSAVDKAQATKKRDKYIKQLAEIRAYYPALSHIALQRIELDLDDGVKANYAKFQGIEVSVEGEKKQKIDLLAKI